MAIHHPTKTLCFVPDRHGGYHHIVLRRIVVWYGIVVQYQISDMISKMRCEKARKRKDKKKRFDEKKQGLDQHDPSYNPPGPLVVVVLLLPPTQTSPPLQNSTEIDTPTYKLTGTLPPKTPTNARAGQYVQLLPPPQPEEADGYVKG